MTFGDKCYCYKKGHHTAMPLYRKITINCYLQLYSNHNTKHAFGLHREVSSPLLKHVKRILIGIPLRDIRKGKHARMTKVETGPACGGAVLPFLASGSEWVGQSVDARCASALGDAVLRVVLTFCAHGSLRNTAFIENVSVTIETC